MFQGSEPSKRLCEAEVDNFFAEIDALGVINEPLLSKPNGSADTNNSPEPPTPSESPPPPPPPVPPPPPDSSTSHENCPWTEYVDPQTEFVYYYNIESQETTWTMPDEYRQMKERLVENEDSTNQYSQFSKMQSKSASNAVGEIEYLQEYVANSETSGSSDESSSSDGAHVQHQDSVPSRNSKEGKQYKASRKRRKSRSKGDTSMNKKQRKTEKSDNDTEEILIGPKLPSGIIITKVGSEEEDIEKNEYSDDGNSQKVIDSEIGPQLPNNLKSNDDKPEGTAVRFIGPRLPSKDEDDCDKNDVTLESKTQSQEQTNNDSSQFQEAQEELSETIREQSSMLLSKLQFLNVTMDSLPLLSILLIKLETRYSDWSCGALTLERMVSTLNEAMVEMADYEGSAVPAGWKCYWDNSTGRYYYENQITSECQWEYPTGPVTDPAPPNPAEESSSSFQNQEGDEKQNIPQEEVPSVQSPQKVEPPSDDVQCDEHSLSGSDKNESDDESEARDEEKAETDSSAEEVSSTVDTGPTVDIDVTNEKEESDEKQSSLADELDVKEVMVDNEESSSPQTTPNPIIESSETVPMPVDEKPVVKTLLRLVAYDDDDDSDSQSEDEETYQEIEKKPKPPNTELSNSSYLPHTCRTDQESVDHPVPVGTHQSLSSVVSASSNQSSPVISHETNPCVDGDDMEVDSDNEPEISDAVINVAVVPPPPPPPLPLLPARPPTPPPPPPPPPHRPTLTSVPQSKTQVTIETAPASAVIVTPIPEPSLPIPSEMIDEFDDDQSPSTAATKRKKQRATKNKIGLKGIQNLFQKWQQVQENL